MCQHNAERDMNAMWPLAERANTRAQRITALHRNNIAVTWDAPRFLQRAENRTAEVKGADSFHQFIGLESSWQI